MGEVSQLWDPIVRKLVIFTLISSFNSFGFGVVFSWPSPALVKLKSNDTDQNPLGRPATDEEISWIGSIQTPFIIISSLLVGYLSRFFGPKVLLLAESVLVIISFAILSFAEKIYLYYIARVLCGLGIGGFITIHVIYMTELAPEKIRGAMVLSTSIFTVLGGLYSIIIGSFASVKVLSGFCILPLGLFFFIGQLLPEGPKHLVATSREEEALDVMASLRRESRTSLEREILRIKKEINKDQSSMKAYKEIFTVKTNLKMFSATSILLSLLETSGNSILLTYLQIIFKAAKTTISDSYTAVGSECLQLIVIVALAFIMDTINRKTSGVGSAVSLIFLGLYFFLLDQGYSMDHFYWLPLISIFLYIVLSGIGVKSIPMIALGEVLHPNTKEKSASLIVSISLIASFLCSKFFPSLVNLLGMGIVIWVLAFNNLFLMGFYMVCFPETTGKSLSQIQDIIK